MALRRRCSGRTCKNGRRCLEHLWFDVMYRGSRFRMPVNEFAIPRMELGKQRPIGSLEEARDWERHFIGEIKAGRDPRRPRSPRKSSDAKPTDVARFLDTYMDRCVKPAALKSVRSISSRVSVLKEHLGDLPLDALEEPDDINRFKTESETTPTTSNWRRCTARSKRSGFWRMGSSQSRGERARLGTENSSSGSTFAGMTFGTKAPAVSWPTVWTSASFS